MSGYEAKLHGGIAEEEARDDALADFESALDDLISEARHQAYTIGGDFRGPGIANEMNKVLKTREIK